MPTTPFTPTLHAPGGYGWGGQLRRRPGERVIICLLLWPLYLIISGQYSLRVWTIWTPLWALGSALWLYFSCRPRPPLVACDPQGLTLYHGNRIHAQWRWQALADVFTLTSGEQLAICPRSGAKQLYRHPRLSATDYADIARVAQDYLHQRATPPVSISGQRNWYKDCSTVNFANVTLLLLQTAIAFILWLFYDGWFSLDAQLPLPLLIVFNLAGLALLAYLLRRLYHHYRYYYDPAPRVMARLDAHGLHLYRPNGRCDSLAWQDMRSIRAVLRRAKHDPLTNFRLSDRYGDSHRFWAGYLADDDIVQEIAVCADAILHRQTPPPQTTGLTPAPSRSGRVLFWLNLLLLPLIAITPALMPGRTTIPAQILFFLLILLNFYGERLFARRP